MPSATALTRAHIVASKAAGEAFADLAGVSPPTKKLIVAAALAGAAASHAVHPHVPAAAPLKGGKAKMPSRACSPLPPIEEEPNVAETSTAPAPKSSTALTLKALPRGTKCGGTARCEVRVPAPGLTSSRSARECGPARSRWRSSQARTRMARGSTASRARRASTSRAHQPEDGRAIHDRAVLCDFNIHGCCIV